MENIFICTISNETEVEESPEDTGMDNGAHAANLRRLGKACAQDRLRNAGQVEIEENPRVHEEGACKELAHVLPWNPPEHVRHLSSAPRCADPCHSMGRRSCMVSSGIAATVHCTAFAPSYKPQGMTVLKVG